MASPIPTKKNVHQNVYHAVSFAQHFHQKSINVAYYIAVQLYRIFVPHCVLPYHYNLVPMCDLLVKKLRERGLVYFSCPVDIIIQFSSVLINFYLCNNILTFDLHRITSHLIIL